MLNKSVLVSLFLVLASVLASAQAPGSPAPDFTGVDSNGESFRLSDSRGRIVVLEWTNHDCPYVRKHYGTGNMQNLQAKWTNRDVVWVSVISSAPGKQGHVDGNEANRLTRERNASPSFVILDPGGDIGRLYRATNTPHMFVIDMEGELVYAGAIDNQPSSRSSSVEGARNYVDEALEDISAGRPVVTSATRAYGCSVKY